MESKRILIIAGSDSSGGALVTLVSIYISPVDQTPSGLEADQRVMTAHQCYSMTATTALTVQNTLGVHNVHHVPSNIVRQQIEACIEDIGVDVVKVGELSQSEVFTIVRAADRSSRNACICRNGICSSRDNDKVQSGLDGGGSRDGVYQWFPASSARCSANSFGTNLTIDHDFDP